MARVRSRDSALERLLAAAPGAVYALDDQRKVVFCNAACGELLAVEPDTLLGQRCDYRSSATESTLTDVAASLCPPPEVFAGRAVVSDMELLHSTGRLLTRRVAFHPLGSDALHCVGAVAFVGDPVSGASRHSEAAELHHRLWTLRRGLLANCQVDELIGISPAIQRVREQIELALRGQMRVLVCGPTGSGREHVARLLHQRAAPALMGQLVPLCCPLLGAELLQTTITKLVRQCNPADASGETLQAQPGRAPTLLLLEADQLSEEAQSELAGFLTLPGFELYSIATAGGSLIELAEQGNFRTDVAHALSTLTIDMPPLLQRAEDIPLLSQYFLEKFNARGDRQLSGFSSEALDELTGYAWPDNVDELSDLVESASRGAEGPVVEIRDLPSQIHLATITDAHPRKIDEPIVLDEFLADIEKELIVRALQRSKGNKTRAAELLSMNRARFHRRLQHFKIP